MKVEIADIVVVPREVEIEPHCSSCGADLRVQGALRMREWREESVDGRLALEPGGPFGGIAIELERIVHNTDDGSGWVELRCNSCKRVVLAGLRVIVTNAATRIIAQRIVTE